MTRIFLIRHAEAEGNLYRIAHGQYNGLITDRGYRQIEVLRRRFENEHIDAVYSSDLFRARTTAKAIYEAKGLPLHLEPAFREIHMGIWEGRLWQELNTEFEEQMFCFNRKLDGYGVEGSETCRQVLDRFLPALERVAKTHDGQTVAVFSHGAAVRMVLGTLQGLPLSEVGETPHGDNTAVALLEYDNGKFSIVYMNDNSHQVEAGLSTFAKQTWWKDKRMMSGGQYYRPMDAETAAKFAVPDGGERIAVWFDGKPVGAVQLLPEKDPTVGWIGYYYLTPEMRGRNYGIPPLGQAVMYYRERGIDRLRIETDDPDVRGFFAHYGFYPLEGNVMEKYTGYGE
ncbi:MAG: GNAT family N-acetyltransferase [Oscillospiraceae bacterium]|nr:GNAT family N-acetyltransferase [Oscillospiraceae bacterium]